ncbi:MAG: FkbM family methyltransferase [Nannocystaceae bacterium]|nr:FkbM family methyltransferase [Nannocystaceae bacterium]
MRPSPSFRVALTFGVLAGLAACRSDDAPARRTTGDGESAGSTTPEGTPSNTRGPFPPKNGSAPVVDLGEASLELNPEDRSLSAALWATGTWEQHQTEFILERLAPGDTFLDVGANLGYYTVLAAKKVGPTGRVFAFEPDPESFALLQRNVKRNGLHNVVLENKAAGAELGTLRLFLSSANRGDHRVYDPGGGRTSIEVEVIVLDDYFAKAGGPVHVAKIDTRGAECAIVDGMNTMLAEHQELALAVAYYPQFVTAMGYDPKQCFGRLTKHGYALSWVDEVKHQTTPTTVEALPATVDGALLLPRRAKRNDSDKP